ncbi:MAG: CHAT domain-containing protein [Gaiellaceae bacterium]
MSTAIALSSLPVLLQLVQRDEYRGRPAELEQAFAQGVFPGVDASELPLLAAAAALNVGDAKRALRTLDEHRYEPGSDGAVVADALSNLGNALDRNWFPGGAGAVLEDGDIGRIAGDPPAAASAAPPVQLLVMVIRDVVAMAPVWRNIVDNARRNGQTAATDAVLGQVAGVGQRLQAYGAPLPVAYLSLLHADLLWRAGQWQAVSPLHTWAFQTYQAAGDVVGVGACWLVKGDWSATPESHPELLGLSVDAPTGQTTAVIEADPATARTCYEQAKACFENAGATRGLAAVELRLAYLDGGDHLDRARSLARESGDTALERIAAVHHALATPDVDARAVGGEVAEWSKRDGSYSYARGMARLCLAQARHLRESGEILRGRAPLRIADAINSGIGAVLEPALVSGEYAQLYGGANYRRAMLVLTELGLEEQLTAAPGDDPLAWLSLVDRSMQASATAIGLRDPDAIARGAQRLERVLATAPMTPSDAVTFTAAVARSTVAQASVLVPLYRGAQARDDGRQDDAERFFDEAQEAVAKAGDDMLRVVVLATRRQRDEGLRLCRELVATAKLTPDFAAELLQRLGAPAEAKAQLAKVQAMGAPAPSARPWERLVLPAEIHESLGDANEAATLAAQGVDEFEHHLARLSRDVLRLSAMDDVNVVSLYTTAVRAELDRNAVDESFRMADRCRGIALADLFASDRTAGASTAVIDALRSWHRDGVRLASLFEQIRWDDGTDAAGVRMSIAEAERSLDDAEAKLDAAAPSLLRARREPPPTPSLDEIQALLQPQTLLLQYHFFDEEVIAWAVTAGGTRAVRTPGVPRLTGEAGRFLRACADRGSAAGERNDLAAELAQLLISPFERELRESARVVVVPHARMGLLPFHLLPFEGDVLGAKRPVSYLPASSVAPRWAGHARPRLGADAVVVGDPAYAATRKLPRLHGARIEAIEVARLLDAPALVDSDATAAAVSARIRRAHSAHFATHGLVPPASPNSAQLALTGEESLTIADLMGLDTELDLAVLSACDTGRGSATAGGEVIGLTRALLAAGARDVVVSLWPVDDTVGCLTMVDFYAELLEGGDVTQALSAAQARVRAASAEERETRFAALSDKPASATSREWGGAASRPPGAVDPAHPYFWGPFVHIGL